MQVSDRFNMQTIRFITLLLCTVLLVQCKPKRDPNKTYFDKPSEYNDYIVIEQKKVMESFDVFAGTVNNGNIDSMNQSRNKLCENSEIALASMKKLADFKEDTMFRTAAIDFFSFVNEACKNQLKEIVEIAAKDSLVNEVDIERIHILSQEYTLKEKEKNEALMDAQDKFAKKFNVIIK